MQKKSLHIFGFVFVIFSQSTQSFAAVDPPAEEIKEEIDQELDVTPDETPPVDSRTKRGQSSFLLLGNYSWIDLILPGKRASLRRGFKMKFTATNLSTCVVRWQCRLL